MDLKLKYRPRTFDSVIGQRQAVSALKGMFKEGRVSQAMLIQGSSGIGKTSLARIIAHYVNCEKFDRENVKACGTCDYCQAVIKDQYPGVEEINFADSRGIDTVREIIDGLDFDTPYNKKVYILDEIHSMTSQAQNAILKPLEEPPPHVIFILLTTDPEKLLPTVRNRCTPISLARIGDDQILGYLSLVSKKEERTVPDYALKFITTQAQGVMRQALNYLQLLFQAQTNDPAIDLAAQDTLYQLLGTSPETSMEFKVEYLIKGIYFGRYSYALAALNKIMSEKSLHPKGFFDRILEHHMVTIGLMVDTAQACPGLHNPYYDDWALTVAESVRYEGPTKKGLFKLTLNSATRIAELLLELTEKCRSFEVDPFRLAQVYTLKMVRLVNEYAHEATTEQSPLHKKYAPRLYQKDVK